MHLEYISVFYTVYCFLREQIIKSFSLKICFPVLKNIK